MNKPPSDALIARAAEERAGGATWAATAARLDRSAETVRRWPAMYPDRWQAALRDAEFRLVGDAGAEALLTLRQLLRSDDEKVRRDCARALIRLRLDMTRLGLNTPADRPASELTPEAVRFIAYLDGHSDDELAQLTADLRPPRHPDDEPAEPAAAARDPRDAASGETHPPDDEPAELAAGLHPPARGPGPRVLRPGVGPG
jgi:hypothetical protein